MLIVVTAQQWLVFENEYFFLGACRSARTKEVQWFEEGMSWSLPEQLGHFSKAQDELLKVV